MPTGPVKDHEPTIVMQVRGARGMLGWSQIDLAERAGIAARTLASFEAGRRIPHDSTIERIVAAFAEAGLEFVTSNGGFGLFLNSDRIPVVKPSSDYEDGSRKPVSTKSTALA